MMEDDDAPPDLVDAGPPQANGVEKAEDGGLSRKVPITIVTGLLTTSCRR